MAQQQVQNPTHECVKCTISPIRVLPKSSRFAFSGVPSFSCFCVLHINARLQPICGSVFFFFFLQSILRFLPAHLLPNLHPFLTFPDLSMTPRLQPPVRKTSPRIHYQNVQELCFITCVINTFPYHFF